MARKAGRQNDMLDLLKCISIYSVVLAHVPLPGQFGRAICALAKFSVPVFFLISGYFSWGKDSRTLGRRAVHAWKLLIGVSLLLLAFGCVLARRQGQAISAYLLSRMTPFFFKEAVLFQVLPLPYSWPMWYMASLAIVYVLWWGMTRLSERRGKQLPYDVLGVVSLGLLVLHISLAEGRAMLGLEPVANQYVRNAWLDAFPFFAIGAWFGQHRERFAQAGRGTGLLWAGVGAGALLTVWEFSRVDVVDVFVGTTLMAFCMVAAALRRPQVSSPLLKKTACFCGRSLTFSIYAIHVPLYGVMTEWRSTVPVFDWMLSQGWLRPVWIGVLSTAAALVLYYLNPARRRKNAA